MQAALETQGKLSGALPVLIEQERAVVFHAVKFPAVAEGVKEKVETAARIGPIKLLSAFTEVAFLGHAAADDAAGILEIFDVEQALEFGPFGGELFVLEQGFFLFVEFLGLFEHFFVTAGFDEAFEFGNDGLGFSPRRWIDQLQKLIEIFEF